MSGFKAGLIWVAASLVLIFIMAPALSSAQETQAPPAPQAPERMNSPWDFTAEGQLDKGLTSLDAGNYQNAVAAFTKAIGMKPEMIDAYILRGIVYGEHLGKPELAYNDFNKALQLDPANSNAYALRGATLSKMGKFDQAIQDFDKALQLTPGDAYTYYSRGQAWKAKADLDKAMEDTRMAISIDSGNAEYQQALADLETLKAKTRTAKVKTGTGGCFVGEAWED